VSRSLESRAAAYREVLRRIELVLEDETDWVAAMATVACELHHGFDHFDWTGFYRAEDTEGLVIGPYQGGHGCLRIRWGHGVCGTAAAEGRTLVVPDVREFPGHIACSSTTLSEIVVPIVDRQGRVFAVLDVDSDRLDAFGPEDVHGLEELCRDLGRRFG
jgi:GAF domain-containing protein